MSLRPDEPALPSADLLRRVQKGDERAADEVFAHYVERLTRLARSRLAARLAARVDPEDIVQSAYRSFFVAARQGRFAVHQSGDLWRLLVEVTLHKLYRQTERHRAKRRTVERERAASDGSVWQRVTDREPTPEQAAIAAESLEAVLAKLPPRGREVVELVLQGYEQREVAARLGCTDRTVRRWIDAAREILEAQSAGRARLPPSLKFGAGLRPRRSPDRRSPGVAGRPAVIRGAGSGDPRPTRPAVKRGAGSGDPRPTNKPRPTSKTTELKWSDYLLQKQIGAGSTGKVYQALERSSRRQVAVKFLRKALVSQRPVVERFLREAQTVAALKHPGIVGIEGIGCTPGGGWFLVMELVGGRDLHRVAARRSVSPQQSAAWVAAAARIVQYAHDQGIIHCDLKPGNLLVNDDEAIRVTDFGLAVRAADEAPAALLAGTPAFMAPEQVDPCWGPISARTDVWGLGAVLYFLLLGRPPHTGGSVAQTLARVVSGKPVVIPARRKGVPRKLLDVCRRCLAKRPEDRYRSAEEVAEALA